MRARDLAQGLKHLPGEYEIVSVIPSTKIKRINFEIGTQLTEGIELCNFVKCFLSGNYKSTGKSYHKHCLFVAVL